MSREPSILGTRISRAAFAAALFLLLTVNGLGAEPYLAPIPLGATAFPYGSEVLLLSPSGVSRLGDWPGDARPRESACFEGGFIAWERKGGEILRAGAKGLESLGRVNAAQVFLSEDRILARSDLFTDKKGFEYIAYRIGSRIEKTSSFYLNCFPADCLFIGRRCYLAGADREDRLNRLYEVDLESGKFRVIAELPKNRDFGRLVSAGSRLWYFLIPALPRKEAPAVWSFGIDAARGASWPLRLELSGLPAGFSCLYGSALTFEGRFWLPLVSGEGKAARVSLFAFDPQATKPKVLSSIALDTGLYAPLGLAGEGTSECFYALGFLYVKDQGAFSLLRLQAGASQSTPLPLSKR